MKKRTLRSIAIVIAFCLVIPNFSAMVGATDYTPLRYDTSSICSAVLSISSSNYAECKGTISLYSQYRDGTIKTDEPRTLDFSGVRGFLVTNVCIVQRSAA